MRAQRPHELAAHPLARPLGFVERLAYRMCAVEPLDERRATSFAVYLHGVDASAVSDQEVGNRRELEAVAQALRMRVALARASRPCPGRPSSSCWGWAFDERELDEAASVVRRSALSCFGPRPFGAIGFSKGGYAVGSAAFSGPLEREPNARIRAEPPPRRTAERTGLNANGLRHRSSAIFPSEGDFARLRRLRAHSARHSSRATFSSKTLLCRAR
jgi:hypothetical protein